MRFDPIPVEADDVRERIGDILSQPEYQPRKRSLVDRFLDWLAEAEIFPDIGGVGGAGPGNLIAWVVLLALLVGVVYLVARLVQARRPRRRSPKSEDTVYGTEAHVAASRWFREAEQLAAAGDHRGAIRCRHQGLLATWIERGVVDHVVGRTAAATHRAAREAAGLAERDERTDDSRILARTFDDVWYGGRPVAAADDADVAARVDRLVALRRDPHREVEAAQVVAGASR